MLIGTIPKHYNGVIMGAMVPQITSLTIVYSTVYLGADQRKHQNSASLAFVRGIHRWLVNSPHKWPVTLTRFPLDDVKMKIHTVFPDSPHVYFMGCIAYLDVEVLESPAQFVQFVVLLRWSFCFRRIVFCFENSLWNAVTEYVLKPSLILRNKIFERTVHFFFLHALCPFKMHFPDISIMEMCICGFSFWDLHRAFRAQHMTIGGKNNSLFT